MIGNAVTVNVIRVIAERLIHTELTEVQNAR